MQSKLRSAQTMLRNGASQFDLHVRFGNLYVQIYLICLLDARFGNLGLIDGKLYENRPGVGETGTRMADDTTAQLYELAGQIDVADDLVLESLVHNFFAGFGDSDAD